MINVEMELSEELTTDKLVESILLEKERILQEGAKQFLEIAKNEWTGWNKSTGRSRAGWESESDEDSITLSNYVDYVEWVHHAGIPDLTYQDIFDFLDNEVSPQIVEELNKIFEEKLNA